MLKRENNYRSVHSFYILQLTEVSLSVAALNGEWDGVDIDRQLEGAKELANRWRVEETGAIGREERPSIVVPWKLLLATPPLLTLSLTHNRHSINFGFQRDIDLQAVQPCVAEHARGITCAL